MFKKQPMIDHTGASRGEARSSGVSGTEWLDALELLWLDLNMQFSATHMLYEQVAFICSRHFFNKLFSCATSTSSLSGTDIALPNLENEVN